MNFLFNEPSNTFRDLKPGMLFMYRSSVFCCMQPDFGINNAVRLSDGKQFYFIGYEEVVIIPDGKVQINL